MNSCIYRGQVRHRRMSPTQHAFSYDLFMMYIDLDELPALFDRYWLWSARRPAPAWFRRADYLGPSDRPLHVAVRDLAEERIGTRPEGPIRMLTHLRYLGYVQNPVTFYYCFENDGTTLHSILAEITNTPWGERHTYAMRSAEHDAAGTTHRFRKAFHISPFMSMDHDYAWRFSEPGDRLFVHMENRVDGDKVFDASLLVRRREISSASLAAALARYPWMTARVVAGIYFQALRLRLKGTPYHEHPARGVA